MLEELKKLNRRFMLWGMKRNEARVQELQQHLLREHGERLTAEGEVYNLAVSKEEKEAVDAGNVTMREIVQMHAARVKERESRSLLWQIRYHLGYRGKTDLTCRELGRRLQLHLEERLEVLLKEENK